MIKKRNIEILSKHQRASSLQEINTNNQRNIGNSYFNNLQNNGHPNNFNKNIIIENKYTKPTIDVLKSSKTPVLGSHKHISLNLHSIPVGEEK